MKIQPFRSIRAKLAFSLGLPLLLSYVALLSVDFVVNRRAAIAQLQTAILERADNIARVIDARLTNVSQLAQTMSTRTDVNTTQTPAARAAYVLRDALSNRWVHAATVVLTDDRGAPIAYAVHRGDFRPFANRPGEFGPPRERDSDPREGERRFNRRGPGSAASPTTLPAWHSQSAELTAGGWFPPDATRPLADQTWTYVEPLRAEGQVIGAIGLEVASHSLRTLRPGPPEGGPPATTAMARAERSLPAPPPPEAEGTDLAAASAAATRIAAGELNDFAIFDSSGRLAMPAAADDAAPPTQTFFETADALRSPAMADAARRAIAGESSVVSVSGLLAQISSVPDDADHWLALAPLPSTGGFLVTAVGESQYLGPVMQRLAQRAFFLAGGLVVMLLVVLWIAMRMSRRLERLDLTVARLATGELGAPLPDPGPPDEIGRLARGVANMSRQLREHVGALTAQTAAREKVEGELRIARQIQLDLLPKTFPPFPDRTDFDLHAVNEPARQVAGDFYDFFFTNDGRLTIVVADVSGKGVPAALLMAVTRTLVRTLAADGRGPAEIVRGVNEALAHDSTSHMFVTMFLCRYDPATGGLRYVNAGHPPPLRLRADMSPAPFCDRGSPIVGLAESGLLGDFEEHDESLALGDAMLIYTDGVTDAPGANGDDYLGTSGLIDALADDDGRDCRTVCAGLLAKIIGVDVSRLRDDTTLLALRRTR